MNTIDFLSRYLHILTAITLVGGTIYTAFVLLPSLGQLSEGEKGKIGGLLEQRWKRFVHLGILLFLVTGFYNYFRAMPNHKGDGLYHALIGTKIILAFGVFFIASALTGRSAALAFIRNSRPLWIKIYLILALVIIGFSSFVKVRGNPNLPTQASQPSKAE